ncbi:MAG: SH3 domain-containing protein [Alphaproteobacteria bacterium]|nr:SH3 domain-containing protein [Alphaproteobacteria bacterium]
MKPGFVADEANPCCEGTAAATWVGGRGGGAELDPIDAIFIAQRAGNIRAGPSVQAQRIGSLTPGMRLLVLGRLRGQPWYLVEYQGNANAYVQVDLLTPWQEAGRPEAGAARGGAQARLEPPAQSPAAPQRGAPAPPRAVYNVLPALYAGRPLPAATQAVRQAFGMLGAGSVLSDGSRTTAEQTVVTTQVLSMRVRQEAPPPEGPSGEQQAAEIARQVFGSFLRMPTPAPPTRPTQPTRLAMTTYEGEVSVTATAPDGRSVSEQAPVQLSLDARIAPDDGIARAVQQAAELAARRVGQRLAEQR